MELTVLGHRGPYPSPGGACSGYLVRAGKTKILLDLGAGTLSRLMSVLPQLNMDGVVLSHLHSDHCSDMFVLRYALQQYADRGVGIALPLAVIAPDEPKDEFRLLAASGVYDMTVAKDLMQGSFGDFHIMFNRGTHPVPSYLITLIHEGKKLVYTGDTGMRHDLEHICRDADILLADVNFLDEELTNSPAPHMSAREVGELAQKAGVKRLICTHTRGGNFDEEKLLLQVKRIFEQAELAIDMKTYTV